jgi:hypothetical protein
LKIWYFVVKILRFVVVEEVYWALALAELFEGLLWGKLFVVGVEGR